MKKNEDEEDLDFTECFEDAEIVDDVEVKIEDEAQAADACGEETAGEKEDADKEQEYKCIIRKYRDRYFLCFKYNKTMEN